MGDGCRFLSPLIFQKSSIKESTDAGCRMEEVRVSLAIWVFPQIGVPQNGWFIMENP